MKFDPNQQIKNVSVSSLNQVRPVLTPVEDFKSEWMKMTKDSDAPNTGMVS